MMDLHLDEMILTAIKNAIPIVWSIIAPLVYVAIAIWLIWFVIKKIAYYMHILAGSSPREARRNADLFKDLIDLLSTLIGIYKR